MTTVSFLHSPKLKLDLNNLITLVQSIIYVYILIILPFVSYRGI